MLQASQNMNMVVSEYLWGIIQGAESQNVNSETTLIKGDTELKNIRKRIDGRWEYRKMINNKRYSIFANTQKELIQRLEQISPTKRIELGTTEKQFYFLAKQWYELFKKDRIKSESNYRMYIKNEFNTPLFRQNIGNIKLEDLQMFINSINKHRKAKYCYNIIKNVYKFALQKEIIKKDISQFLQSPINKGVKGTALTLREQQLVLDNLDKTPIKNEILFYLLVGCRRTEAMNVKCHDINFDKNVIFIDGTKTKAAKRYVNISETFKEVLRANFDKMFIKNADYYTKQLKQFLDSLNIKGKTLHDLRHTFSTNLYYLGVPDKQRQYLLGHSSIVITNDIYTTLDPTITKEDIHKLYNNLYPQF